MWRTMVVLWIKWISTANKISSTQTGVTHWTLNWQEYRERDRQRDRQRERERDRERDRERERLIDIETARDTLVTEAGMHLFVSCFAINKSKQQVIWESTWHFPTVFGASLSDKKSLENIHIDCNYDALYHFVLILKFQKSQQAQVKCLHKILTQARSDSYSVSDAFWLQFDSLSASLLTRVTNWVPPCLMCLLHCVFLLIFYYVLFLATPRRVEPLTLAILSAHC